MRKLAISFSISTLFGSIAMAEPFQEVTVGVPVASIAEAEAWYLKLLGDEVEILRPGPGVVEFKAAPGVWLQIFEPEAGQPTASVVRFKIDDFPTFQKQSSGNGIDTGEATAVPDIVTFSEFTDPDGNALGLYSLP